MNTLSEVKALCKELLAKIEAIEGMEGSGNGQFKEPHNVIGGIQMHNTPRITKPRLTITELAEILQCHRQTATKRMRVIGVRRGSDGLVSAKDVARLLTGERVRQ